MLYIKSSLLSINKRWLQRSYCNLNVQQQLQQIVTIEPTTIKSVDINQINNIDQVIEPIVKQRSEEELKFDQEYLKKFTIFENRFKEKKLDQSQVVKDYIIPDDHKSSYLQYIIEEEWKNNNTEKRKRFQFNLQPRQGDILQIYQESTGSVVSGLVDKVEPLYVTVFDGMRFSNHPKKSILMVIPTSNQQIAIEMHRVMLETKLEFNIRHKEVFKTSDAGRISKDAQNLFAHFYFFMEGYLGHFTKQRSLNSHYLVKEFSKPQSGVCFNGKRPWDESQGHLDNVPLIKAANVFAETTKEMDDDKSNKVWRELFLFSSTFNYINRQSFDLVLINSKEFACNTYIRSRHLLSFHDFFEIKSLESKMFIKYCIALMVEKSKGYVPHERQLDLLADSTVPLIHNHVDFTDSNGQPLPNKDELTKYFKFAIKLLHEMPIFTDKNSIFLKKSMNSLFEQMGLQWFQMKNKSIELLDFLEPNQTSSRSKQAATEYKVKKQGNLLISTPKSIIPSIVKPLKSNLKRKIIKDISFAIDDIETKDVDDSVSIIKRGNDLICMVHVADVSQFVEPYSQIDNWAYFKSNSIYLPNQTTLMLPNNITQECSLAPSKTNKCMTFEFKINEDGTVGDYDIYASDVENLVKVTYEEVDDLLVNGNTNRFNMEQVESLQLLHNTMKLRKSKRTEPLFWDLPSVSDKVRVDKTTGLVSLKRTYDTPSSLLVSEMAICANNVSAHFCFENKLSIPNRCQAAPHIDSFPFEQLKQLYHPLALTSHFYSFTEHSTITTQSNGHFSLGLNHYAWSTSPIRRYSDILVHRQIKNYLQHKNPLYHDLTHVAETIDKNTRRIQSIQHSCEIHWKYQYLMQQGIGKVYQAIMLPINESNPLAIRYQLQDINLSTNFITEIPIAPTNKPVNLKAELLNNVLRFFPTQEQ